MGKQNKFWTCLIQMKKNIRLIEFEIKKELIVTAVYNNSVNYQGNFHELIRDFLRKVTKTIE